MRYFKGTNITYTVVDKQIILSTNKIECNRARSDYSGKRYSERYKKEKPFDRSECESKRDNYGAITDLTETFRFKLKRERYWRSLILDMLLKR